MSTDYGTDISDFPDIDPMMPEFAGRLILLESMYRRLTTPRGSVFYDLNYGYNIRELLGESFGPGDLELIQAEISRECLKDERIVSAQAKCKYKATTGQLLIALTLQDGDGPFALVLSVDKVTVEVLRAG